MANYTFQVYITDKTDLDSNVLEGSLYIQSWDVPGIFSLAYSPTSIEVGSGGGSTGLNISVKAYDLTNNIETLRIVIFDSMGNEVGSKSYPFDPEYIIIIDDRAMCAYTVDTSVVGEYTFEISVVDKNYNGSNVLTGSYSITN